MDLYYYKLFYPELKNQELENNLKLNKNNINYSIKTFYEKYPYFNIFEYKKFNNDLSHLTDLEAMIHYHTIGVKNNYLSSIKDFYILYPEFDIVFYKLFYYNKNNKINNLELLNNYHHKDKYINKIVSLKDFIKIYNVDFIFLKKFYDIFTYKNDIEIVKIIVNNQDNLCAESETSNMMISPNPQKTCLPIDQYIYSEIEFYKIHNEFNINIYKAFNNNLIFDDDVKYLSYWYHIDKNNYAISSIKDFYIKYNDFNINLYKYIYNITNDKNDEDIIVNWYNKVDKEVLIYSNKKFIDYIDDFNYVLFKKHNIPIKNKKNNEIIEYYINNINNINLIYSEKLFYLKYSLFNIEEYKKFNNINSTINLKIINEYYTTKNKDSIVTSIKDFYIKYPDYSVNVYKYFLNNNQNDIFFDNDEDYIYHWYINKNNNSAYPIEKFNKFYFDFNLKIYKHFNKDLLNYEYLNDDNLLKVHENIIKNNLDIIYSIKTFHNKYPEFNKKIYSAFNDLSDATVEDIIISWDNSKSNPKLIYSEESFYINNPNFDINIYKGLNIDIKDLNEEDLIIHWYKYSEIENRIYSIQSFYKKYPELDFNINSKKYNFDKLVEGYVFKEYTESEKIIYWMNSGIYNSITSNGYVGRNIVTEIYEVLLDLLNPLPKDKLKKGISLIIRAKNEELNIKDCIETVVDLVDEIIFVDNGSTDLTYDIVKKYCEIYKNIKLYKYNISVSKAGIEHQNALKNNNKNTLGTFYNWCLSKATYYNVFKWDADFICIRNNFIEVVNNFKLKDRDDKFAIWFTGKTLFENNGNYFLNNNSFYNEYRIFSYYNDFMWSDGNICEYTDPYLDSVINSKKIKYLYPLFYEVKRTSIDEFKERSSLIDDRDKNDFNILNNLKENKNLDLINIKSNLINSELKIIIYTPSLSLGGGNQFIINIYEIYKNLGFKVIIFPMKIEKVGNDKFNMIVKEDIHDIKNFNINFIKIYKPNYIIFNSNINFSKNDMDSVKELSKLIFITHSDVAYSNYFIKSYHTYFHKILTVNKYTQTKLIDLLKINTNKFIMINNYSNIKKNNKLFVSNIMKNSKKKTFGIISRFSEDKNIPMFLNALVNVFNIYPDYKCYLVGTENEYYDNFLKKLCKLFKLENNVYFEGYQSETIKYYELFDFIVLPSVSEGCSYNIIEAMTLGVPVVLSDVGGNHELIKNRVGGILYSYEGIKDYESKHVYIENYNTMLENIGYFLNDQYVKDNYNIIIDYATNNAVLIPNIVNCKKHGDYNSNCNECNLLKNKKIIFNRNMVNISNSIIEMVDNDKILDFVKNNQEFIENKFNENIYINQVLDIVKN
jgi:glycosyltransferase involved in cell wall biosynthesis